MKAVPGILPTLLEMICFFSTPTIDVEPEKTARLLANAPTVLLFFTGVLKSPRP